MKRYLYSLLILPLIMGGCNKSMLQQTPVTSLTAATSLVTYTNFQTYAWNLYDYMDGYDQGYNYYPPAFMSQECNSDNMAETLAGNQSAYINGTKIVPASAPPPNTDLNPSDNTNNTYSLGISKWDFSYIRAVDIMLDAISTSQLSASDANHWKSVGYFFRALRYYDLIASFGAVPWIEHSLNNDSTTELYAPRTSRDTVAMNILSNLEWADANIGSSSNDGANSINQACVDALISRFGLFEGTYRKYHNLASANTYLQACVTYSQKVMAQYPTCMSNYDMVYNSQSLAGEPGIILYKMYAPNLTDHEFGPRVMGSTSWNIDLTKDAVQSYLCTDGRPISTSSVYDGDSSMFDEFRNRDKRLYFTVIPPYKVVVGNPVYTWTPTSNPADAEYINMMDTLSTPSNKPLPMQQWSASMTTGTMISEVPHFYLYNAGQPQAISQLGYFYWKQYNHYALDGSGYSYTCCPLFRVEEVWLNYAEASQELGQFTQAIADQTINMLRPRAGLPPMTVANITGTFDATRDADVDPVLWEIRRERRVELMGDGFRFNDIKRWAKGAYLNKPQIGVYVNNADYGNKLSIWGGGASGDVVFFPSPLGWNDKYYLEPIPTQELLLNPMLVQNPGW
jgi:hypothetical protein